MGSFRLDGDDVRRILKNVTIKSGETLDAYIGDDDDIVIVIPEGGGGSGEPLLADHIADAVDAHDASAISYAGGTGMSATDVEAALDELATEKANAADVATDAELAAIIATAVLDGDAAGGVLSGTYPNPGFAVDMATQAELDTVAAAFVTADGVVTAAYVAADAVVLARAATLNVIETDLGTMPRTSGNFQITGLSGLVTGKEVSIAQGVGPYTGKGTREDEAEMDAILATAYVLSATVIQVFWNALTGPVRGNFKFNYLVSV